MFRVNHRLIRFPAHCTFDVHVKLCRLGWSALLKQSLNETANLRHPKGARVSIPPCVRTAVECSSKKETRRLSWKSMKRHRGKGGSLEQQLDSLILIKGVLAIAGANHIDKHQGTARKPMWCALNGKILCDNIISPWRGRTYSLKLASCSCECHDVGSKRVSCQPSYRHGVVMSTKAAAAVLMSELFIWAKLFLKNETSLYKQYTL